MACDIRIYQPNSEGHGNAGEVSYEYGILSPFSVDLRKLMSGGECFALLFAGAPVSETESAAYFTAFLNYGDPVRDGEIVEFQNRIFAQDVPVVMSLRCGFRSTSLTVKYIRGLGLTFRTA